MAHTPGPYRVVKHGDGGGAVERICFGIYAGEIDVAQTQHTYVAPDVTEGMPLEELRSNAYLLAAAPDMLAALQEAEQFFYRLVELHPEMRDTLFGRQTVATRVMAAIAKTNPRKRKKDE